MTTENPNPDPIVPGEQTAPADPPAPAKKSAAKRAPAKKAAAAPTAEAKKDPRSLYLPALPEGFEYTSIVATGARGETITVSPATGKDDAVGSATLAFEGAGLDRTRNYGDMKSAITAGAKAAKAMADVAKREADLAALREQAFDL